MNYTSGDYRSFTEFYSKGDYSPYVKSLYLPTQSLSVLEAVQPCGPLSGPATPSLTIAQALTDGRFGRCDFGAGVIRDKHYRVRQFIVIPAGMPTDIVLEDVNATRIFDVALSLIAPMFEEAGHSPGDFDLGPLHMSMSSDAAAVALIEHIWDEASGGALAWGLAVDSAAVALGGALLRAKQRAENKPVGIAQRGCDRRIRRVISKMEANLQGNVGLEDLAAEVSLSPAHLISIFRRETGLPPHQWLLRLRIFRARELLRRTEHAITEVALSCGFASSQHFASVFRKHVGCTPSQFRHQHLR